MTTTGSSAPDLIAVLHNNNNPSGWLQRGLARRTPTRIRPTLKHSFFLLMSGCAGCCTEQYIYTDRRPLLQNYRLPHWQMLHTQHSLPMPCKRSNHPSPPSISLAFPRQHTLLHCSAISIFLHHLSYYFRSTNRQTSLHFPTSNRPALVYIPLCISITHPDWGLFRTLVGNAWAETFAIADS